MKLPASIGLLIFTCGAALCIAAAQDARDNAHNQAANTASADTDQQAARGERVFKQNCSRCHDAPEAIPPHLTVQILKHMRVRASLPAVDEKALLHFMNRE